MYEADDYDLAGFVVGVVDKNKIIDGSKIQKDHCIIGVASTGPHSNGYSLIRKIVSSSNADLKQAFDGSTLGNKLLAPTQLYAKSVLDMLAKDIPVDGIAHITGGGLMENISRVIPAGLAIEVEQNSWQRPAVFDWLANEGNVSDEEMLRTFNCGIGLCVIVAKQSANAVIDHFKSHQIDAWNIGKTIEHTGQNVVIK
jgi:phosphoribosylformylglycinamidine cyclo-ligase